MFKKSYSHSIKDVVIEREGREYILLDLKLLKSDEISLECKGYYSEYRAKSIQYQDIPILYRQELEGWFAVNGGQL